MKPTILLSPFDHDNNGYIDSVKRVYTLGGYSVEKLSLKNLIYFAYKKNVCQVNWLENMTKNKGFFGLLILISKVLLMLTLGYKIYWVRHNKQAHDLKNDIAILLNSIAMKILSFASSKEFCHGCKYAEENDLNYVPHPLYSIDSHSITTHDGDYYLVFGNMSPYKKLEPLLNEFPKGKRLIVAGKFEDEYFEVCSNIAKQNNLDVTFLNRFIPDTELTELIINAKAILLTNDGESAIVSGSLFYCLSLGQVPLSIYSSIYNELGIEKLSEIAFISSWQELDSFEKNSFDNVRDLVDLHLSDEVVLRALIR